MTGLPVDQTVARLREAGIRVLAADGAGTTMLPEVDLTGPHAWVMGNEAWGLEPRSWSCATRSSASRSTARPSRSTSPWPPRSASTPPREHTTVKVGAMDFTPGQLMDNESAGRAAELIPDGLVAADGEGRILFLNRRATRLLGRSRDELVGADIREAVDLQDSDGTSWWAVTNPWGGLRIRTGHREKLLMLRHNGREVLVTAKYLRPGRNEPVNRVNILMRDALYRRRTEAENAAVISTVAHELRSPLTSVKGFSSTLLRRWDRFSDDQKRLMLETIEADADRVTRLITELLDVSRIDSGRLQIRPLPIDVAAVYHRHVERAVASGQERDRFAIEVPEDLPEVWADPDRLDQILSNLIENAFRHGEGVVTLAAQRSRDDAQRPWSPRATTPSASTCSSPTRARASPPTTATSCSAGSGTGPGRAAPASGSTSSRAWSRRTVGGSRWRTADGGGAQFRISLPSEPPDYLA